MWGDEKFRALTPIPPCGQGLWIYLLAGRETCQIPGVLNAGPGALADSLSWTRKAFDKAFQEVLGKGLAKADFSAPLLWVPKAIFYNMPANANVVKSWRHDWDEVPECGLKVEIWQSLTVALEESKGFQEAFRVSCPKPLAIQEQEQDIERYIGETPKTEESPRPVATVIPPTIEAVTEYGARVMLPADECQKFFNHYESNGWMVGKVKMRNWQRAQQNWASHFRSGTFTQKGNSGANGNRKATPSAEWAAMPYTPG